MPRIKNEEVVEEAPKKEASVAISDDFGREDLNRLRDVVNQLAAK